MDEERAKRCSTTCAAILALILSKLSARCSSLIAPIRNPSLSRRGARPLSALREPLRRRVPQRPFARPQNFPRGNARAPALGRRRAEKHPKHRRAAPNRIGATLPIISLVRAAAPRLRSNQQYVTFSISYSRVPPGVFTSTTSPACLPISARAMGELIDILPNFRSASSSPTI
jgi:hypothetical protein